MHGRLLARPTTLALAALLAWSAVGCSGSDADESTPTPSAAPVGIACPDPSVEAPRRGSTSSVLPAGATEVRLCQGGASFPVQEPRDALVTDLDVLTTLVNTRPEQPRNAFEDCSKRLPVSFVLAFGYPDGTVRTVTGLPGSSPGHIGSVMPPEPPGGWPAPTAEACDRIEVGGVLRSDPDLALEKFTALLDHQRSSTEPDPAWSHRSDCRADEGVAQVASIDEAVEANLCVTFSVEHPVPARVSVSTDDLETFLTDRSPAPDSRDCPPRVPSWTLVGTTAWGDVVRTYGDCGAWRDGQGDLWTPGPDAQAILDRLTVTVKVSG